MQASLTGIQKNFSDVRHRWDNAKLKKSVVFWIVVGAIVLTMILGFTRGGWTTEASATKMAEGAAESAVVARLASICVAQFNADPQRTVKLAELKATGSFQRAKFVDAQGWATMPGDTAPDSSVARQCTQQIMTISE